MALLALGAAVENLMLAATDGGAGVVLGRGADLLPDRGRPGARTSTRRGSPTRWCSSATPTPPTRPRVRPPVDLERLRLRR